MSVPSNTLQTYQSLSNAEDVSDIIYNVSPVDTPFISLAKRGKAEATYTEWPIDSLASADGSNAVIEGDDATNTALTTAARVGNYTQISQKTVVVSTTQDAVRKYGRSKETAYQLVKKGRELKRDMETILLSNQARVVGNSSTAQKLRGLPSWYTTNTSRGSGGANGSASAAATDGTQRNFSETLLKTVLNSLFVNSGEWPSVLMTGPANRANASSQLSGGATKFYDVKDGTLMASVTVYKSDFGPLKIIPNRFQRERDAHIINPNFVEVRYLEPLQQQQLAITGLSRKFQMWAHYTLANLNEAAHGIIADLNTAVL